MIAFLPRSVCMVSMASPITTSAEASGRPVCAASAVIVRPASLTWRTRGPEPDEASLTLAAVVATEEGALLAASRLCQRVVDRVDALANFVVRTAEPDSIRSGGTELPCYLIDIEVSL